MHAVNNLAPTNLKSPVQQLPDFINCWLRQLGLLLLLLLSGMLLLSLLLLLLSGY